jgi:hypothetical protein
MPSDPKNRKKPRRRGTQSRANSDFQSHIESLGLKTPEEYRSWCRQHGFTGALNKDWSQRRQERLRAQKLKIESKTNEVQQKRLQEHVQALGLKTAEEYQAWCRRHGHGDSLKKTPDQRKKEMRTLELLNAEAALGAVRRHTRRPDETIRSIYERKISYDEIKTDYLQKIHEAFATTEGDIRVRDAFLRLLLHSEKRARLFDLAPAVSRFGAQPGNSFIEGLLALAHHERDWLRPAEEWASSTRNARRQFGSLARHLLANFDVPAFMDTAWFQSNSEAARQQEWFKHIGKGHNVRKTDLPLAFTRMMAHAFLQAPTDLTVEEALRWSQVIGMGGDEALARSLLATPLGDSFENEEFWVTVVQFFANNPMLDPSQVGPMVDFIRYHKYQPQETVAEGGRIEYGPPPLPDFSMKGRTVAALLQRMDEWHERLAKESRIHRTWFRPSGISSFDYEEPMGDNDDSARRWTIRELLSSKELQMEGRAMSHCVGSYSGSCARGSTSIWSLQVEFPDHTTQHVLTIAVKNDTRAITQVRGKRNAPPTGKATGIKRVSRSDLDLIREGRNIMGMWIRQENLIISHRTL